MIILINDLKLIYLWILVKVVSAVGSWVRCDAKLTGKTVLITGANTGIGFETTKDLSKRGAKVIMACRDTEKANQAKEKVIFL